MMPAEFVVVFFWTVMPIVSLMVALAAWFRIREIENSQNRDMKYFEYWMRSMENRKQDKETVILSSSDVCESCRENCSSDCDCWCHGC